VNEVPDTSKHFDCRMQCLWVLSIPTPLATPPTLHSSLGSIYLDPHTHTRHGLESRTEQPLSAHHSRGQARCWPAHLLSPLHSHAGQKHVMGCLSPHGTNTRATQARQAKATSPRGEKQREMIDTRLPLEIRNVQAPASSGSPWASRSR